MDMKRRDFLKMTAALAAAGVSPSLLTAGKEQFTVYGAPAMPSVTIAVTALQGKLAKQADVSLKIWRSPDQLRAGVASGQFKVMMSPSNVGVNLRNQGQKVGMVNILTNGITQLVCKGSAIASPQDLVGKKILVPFKNDMPDIVLQALLKKLKIDAHKVSITYAATPPEAVGLFPSKGYHAVILPEPMATASLLKGKTIGINVVHGFDLVKAWGAGVWHQTADSDGRYHRQRRIFPRTQGAVRHLPSRFEKRAQLDIGQPPKRGENRQKLPTRPRTRPSHGLGRRTADGKQRQRSEKRDFEVLRNPDAVQPGTFGRQAAG